MFSRNVSRMLLLECSIYTLSCVETSLSWMNGLGILRHFNSIQSNQNDERLCAM